jgi:hypothetical protein
MSPSILDNPSALHTDQATAGSLIDCCRFDVAHFDDCRCNGKQVKN